VGLAPDSKIVCSPINESRIRFHDDEIEQEKTMTKKRISSVTQLLEELEANVDLIEGVDKRVRSAQLIKHLVAHRVRSGLSQKDIAERMGCTQSRISKLEAGADNDLRFGDMCKYFDSLDLSVRLVITPKSQKAADEIKFHAMCIKQLLHRLVKLTKTDDQVVADGITRFAGIEVPINLMGIVLDTIKHLPQDALERLPITTIHDVTITMENGEECQSDQGMMTP